MDLIEYLKSQVSRYEKRILLYGTDGTAITYRDFDDITDRIAYGLHRIGIERGDHVAVLHPNSPQTLLVYFGIIKAGGIVVPINTIYTSREIKFLLNNSESKALIVFESFYQNFEAVRAEIPGLEYVIVRKDSETVEEVISKMASIPLRPIERLKFDADDTAIMFYTSGTTGNPKGVMLSHRNFCFGGPNIAQSYGLRESDITIAVLPLVHVFSIASPFFGSLSSGGTVVVVERFKPQTIFETIAKYGVTWFPGVPTMFVYLLNALSENTFDLSTLRMGLSGGASLPVEVLKRWEEEFHVGIIEVYGLTESTGLVTANPVYGIRKAGSIGINVSGVSARVVDKNRQEVPPGQVGELIFRGPNATKGYFHLPEQTAEKITEGWVHTGDHAYRDEDGYFFIVGREKELIISGGYNIYPREIEEVLHGHQAVQEAAVIGVPDALKGEVPKALVVLREGAAVTEGELLEYCKKNLAPYKMPKIGFMKELPKNPTGKIMKNELPKE